MSVIGLWLQPNSACTIRSEHVIFVSNDIDNGTIDKKYSGN